MTWEWKEWYPVIFSFVHCLSDGLAFPSSMVRWVKCRWWWRTLRIQGEGIHDDHSFRLPPGPSVLLDGLSWEEMFISQSLKKKKKNGFLACIIWSLVITKSPPFSPNVSVLEVFVDPSRDTNGLEEMFSTQQKSGLCVQVPRCGLRCSLQSKWSLAWQEDKDRQVRLQF